MPAQQVSRGTVAVVLMFQANTLIYQLKTFSLSAVPPLGLLQLILYRTPEYLNMTLPVGMSLAASLEMGRATLSLFDVTLAVATFALMAGEHPKPG